jgi:hypothetical protein
MPKMHLPSLPMLRTGHPVLILHTENIQADEFSEMEIIDNGVRYYCTNEPNSTSTRPQPPCPPNLENMIPGAYVPPASLTPCTLLKMGELPLQPFFVVPSTPMTF